MDKENVVEIHKEFYPDVKKNEVAKCTGKWLELENAISSKPKLGSEEEHFFLICRSKFLFVKCLGARRRPMDFSLLHRGRS